MKPGVDKARRRFVRVPARERTGIVRRKDGGFRAIDGQLLQRFE
jgi:hypothetical protein